MWNNLRARAIVSRLIILIVISHILLKVFTKFDFQAKRDNNRKTGAKVKTIDSVDTLVLDILGQDSAVLDGFSRDSVSFPQVPGILVPAISINENANPNLLTLTGQVPQASQAAGTIFRNEKRQRIGSTLAAVQSDQNNGALRTKRFKLQNRKLELEIMKLEFEMGVEHVQID